MRWRVLVGGALLLAAAGAQVTWGASLYVAGAAPNLVLLGAVALAWARGPRTAMAWSCCGGLLLDLMSAGPIGPRAAGLVVVAYVTGFWARNLARPSAAFLALSAALGAAVYALVLLGLDWLLGVPVLPTLEAGRIALVSCVYNALLMLVAAPLVLRFATPPEQLPPQV